MQNSSRWIDNPGGVLVSSTVMLPSNGIRLGPLHSRAWSINHWRMLGRPDVYAMRVPVQLTSRADVGALSSLGREEQRGAYSAAKQGVF